MSEPASNTSGAGHSPKWLWPAQLIAATSLFLLLAVICVDVTARYFFNSPVTGARELIEILMASLIFAALPITSYKQSHLTIDILDPLVPKALMPWQHLVMSLIGSATLALVAYQMWRYAGQLAAYGDETLFLKIPEAPINYYIAGASALAAVVTLTVGIRSFIGRGKG